MGARFTLPVTFAIRPCLEEDLPNLEWFGLFRCHREIIERAFTRHRAGDNPMLVADCGGFPIGQVWIDLSKRAPSRIGVVWALRVIPCLQRLGIGQRLLAAAEEEIRGRGLTVAEIGVEKQNPGARRLYERLGYRVSGEAAEEYRYRTPEGEPIRAVADQWILRKRLDA